MDRARKNNSFNLSLARNRELKYFLNTVHYNKFKYRTGGMSFSFMDLSMTTKVMRKIKIKGMEH